MSKIRQALDYEKRLAKQKADLEAAILRQSIKYERKLTDKQFISVDVSMKDHSRFHEREHILYDDAIDKASAALVARIDVIDSEVERLRELTTKMVSVDRFEREHATMLERVDTQNMMLSEKVGAEEKVTVRQSAQQETIDKLTANNRWLIGLAVTSGLSLLALLMHLLGIY